MRQIKHDDAPSHELQARIKPYDTKKGHIAVTRCFSALGGLRFTEGRIYEVSAIEAEFLRKVRMTDGNEDSPLCFDVCTPDEMAELLTEEAAENGDVPAPSREVFRPSRGASEASQGSAKPKRVERPARA